MSMTLQAWIVGAFTLAQTPQGEVTAAPPNTAEPADEADQEEPEEQEARPEESRDDDSRRDRGRASRDRRDVRLPDAPELDAGVRPAVARRGVEAPEGPEPPPRAEVTVVHERDGAPPPAPQWKGTGLLVSAGVLGTAALGANVARMALVRRVCQGVGYDPDNNEVLGGDGCVSGAAGMAVLGGTALGFNVMAFGAAAGGGSLRGAWNAYGTAYAHQRRRAAGAQLGVGAGLMVAGLVGYAAVRLVSFADLLGANSCGDQYEVAGGTGSSDSAFAECVRRRYTGYLAGITATQAASVIGVGLLAHGASYRRNYKFYKAVATHRMRLQPSFAPTWAGLAFTGQF